MKCPCCGNYYDIYNFGDGMDGIGEICPICFWQYDIVDQKIKIIPMGPNRVSLIDARKNYKKFGASSERVAPYVRKPYFDELPENNE